jgi:hypothetical protein
VQTSDWTSATILSILPDAKLELFLPNSCILLSRETKQSHCELVCSLDFASHGLQVLHIPVRPNKFSVQKTGLWTHGPHNKLCRKLNCARISMRSIRTATQNVLSSVGNSTPCDLPLAPIVVSSKTPGCTCKTKKSGYSA